MNCTVKYSHQLFFFGGGGLKSTGKCVDICINNSLTTYAFHCIYINIHVYMKCTYPLISVYQSVPFLDFSFISSCRLISSFSFSQNISFQEYYLLPTTLLTSKINLSKIFSFWQFYFHQFSILFENMFVLSACTSIN